MIKIFHKTSLYTLTHPLLRFSSTSKKGFDYQAYEEQKRHEHQKAKYQSRTHDHTSHSEQSQSHTNTNKGIIQLPSQIAKDLTLLNLPKYVSKDDLKKQYHKLAKIYHPDILSHKGPSQIPEQQITKLEEKFKEFNQAYERLVQWIKERDKLVDEALLNNKRPGVTINKEDGSVTYTLGKLKLEGKRSALDKQQILLDMIEDDLTLREPVNLRRHLFVIWAIFGFWYFYRDFKLYYARLSQPIPDVNYDEYFTLNKLM